MTAPSDSAIADLLQSLEEQLLQPASRESSAAFTAFLADDFLEFGSSGHIYNKRQAIDLLADETASTILLTDFDCKLLAPAIALVTYRSARVTTDGSPAITALRSSLWIHRDGRWQLVFHQGTRT